MRNSLLVFGGFADDSQSVLAAIERLAFVSIELSSDCLLSLFPLRRISPELRIAKLAYSNKGRGLGYDPKLAFRHDYSLAPNICENEMAPVPKSHFESGTR
jgi:hypothetical protein